jgi:predicted nucleotidyltransferase
MNAIDLEPRYLEELVRIVKAHLPHGRLGFFGSRVMGKARKTSDVDIALITADGSEISEQTMIRLKEALEDSTLPMRVDVIDWQTTAAGFKAKVEKDLVTVDVKAYGAK